MDNSLIRYHPIIEEVYRRFNIKSIDELFYFLTCDFKKVNLLEKSLRGHIYNNLFTIALDTK
jgi:hypothetical protein